MKVGDLGKKNMDYCGPQTAPENIEEISSLYGIVLDVDANDWGKIAWSHNYGTYWNVPESIEVISGGG